MSAEKDEDRSTQDPPHVRRACKRPLEKDDAEEHNANGLDSPSSEESGSSSSNFAMDSSQENTYELPWKICGTSSVMKTILPEVSQWSLNALPMFGVTRIDESYEEFLAYFTNFQFCGVGYKPQQFDKVIDKLGLPICDEGFGLDFNLPIIYDSLAAKPIDEWPDVIGKSHPEVHKNIREQIQKNIWEMEESISKMDQIASAEPEILNTMATVLVRARTFLTTFIAYLVRQKYCTAVVCEDLFKQFCSVASVELSNGRNQKRKEELLGVKVTCEPDMRLEQIYCRESFPNPRETPREPKFPKVATTAVVKVKKYLPVNLPRQYDRISGINFLALGSGKLTGQLFGEMLLELPYTAIKRRQNGEEMFGISVIGTKVCFLRLNMDSDTLRCAREKISVLDYPLLETELRFSPVFDFTNSSDRAKVWKILYRMGSIRN